MISKATTTRWCAVSVFSFFILSFFLCSSVHGGPRLEHHASNPARPFDLNELTWNRLSLHASRFGLSASADIVLEILESDEASEELIVPLQGNPVELTNQRVLGITFDSSSPRLHTSNQLVFRAEDGAALQRIRLDTKRGDERYRVYRFTDEGVFRLLRKPRQGEYKNAAATWSDESNEFYQFSERLPAGSAVSEPSALLYLASVGLRAVGDALEVVTFFDDTLHIVSLKARKSTSLDVEFLATTGDGKVKIKSKRETLVISLSSRPYGTQKYKSHLKLAGLEEDIKIYIDKVLKLPVELRGKASFFGEIRLRLQQAVLR